MMDATIWLLIIIGVLIGTFLYIKSDKRSDPTGDVLKRDLMKV